jgi:hypothetical protein
MPVIWRMSEVLNEVSVKMKSAPEPDRPTVPVQTETLPLVKTSYLSTTPVATAVAAEKLACSAVETPFVALGNADTPTVTVTMGVPPEVLKTIVPPFQSGVTPFTAALLVAF